MASPSNTLTLKTKAGKDDFLANLQHFFLSHPWWTNNPGSLAQGSWTQLRSLLTKVFQQQALWIGRKEEIYYFWILTHLKQKNFFFLLIIWQGSQRSVFCAIGLGIWKIMQWKANRNVSLSLSHSELPACRNILATPIMRSIRIFSNLCIHLHPPKCHTMSHLW